MPNLYPLSETALTIHFGDQIYESIYKKIADFVGLLKENPFEGFVESVPAYTTLTVFYRPESVPKGVLCASDFVKYHLEKLLDQKIFSETGKSDLIEIPVCYGGELGPDLSLLAETKGITEDEAILSHFSKDYKVYMMGFLPGFPYMGEMDEAIALPRKTAPRAVVEAGSVGIAGKQTGIYPLDSPGGWQIIGKTPKILFDLRKENPFFFKTGDTVRFYPISKEEFHASQENKVNITFPKNEVPDAVVLKPGLYSVLQDEGRFGFRSYGVPLGGAMDLPAHYAANALVGNPKNAPTIECSMGGLAIQFLKKTLVAVTGSGLLRINAQAVAMYQAYPVQKGDILEIKYNNQGLRSYLAVQGGFETKTIMGSRSVVPKLGIGSALKKWDGLQFAQNRFASAPKNIVPNDSLLLSSPQVIRVMEGSEISWVGEEEVGRFLTEQYKIGNRSDRMGCHLIGSPLFLKNTRQLLSTAVCPGTIQLTPGGQMIVLLNDCQTTGGYPRIGQVAAVDLPIFAQMKPGDAIVFKKIEFSEAESLYLAEQKRFDGYFD